MFAAPAVPVFAPGHSASTTMFLRYEDVTQDGRLIPIAAPAGLSGLWRDVLVDHPGQRQAIQQGIIPILTRLTVRTFDTSIRVDRPIEARNGFALAHDRQGDDVSRLFMNVWCEIHGIAGRLGRDTTGERVLAGTVFAEHTFTRPLGPPEQRRVTRLEVDGYPPVPELRYPHPSPTTAGDMPEGAREIAELASDTAEYVFTLDQTDSNQHVNSLVYIRLFLEAVNRRLAAVGRPLRVRATAVDVGYRKPCFAGDRVRAQLRLFATGDRLGAAGFVEGADGKPRCYVRVALGT